VKEPTTIIVNRTIAGTALGMSMLLFCLAQSSSDVSREASVSLSETLIQELDCADFIVIGTPVHKFTAPSALKAWIDQLVRVRRTFNISPEDKNGMIRDRPVIIALSSGPTVFR
jgi:FMN-dependent NADH-azoreductase